MRHGIALAMSTLAILGAGPATAAASSIAITVGPDPVESVTTQLGVTGTADDSGWVSLTVKAVGGQDCGANPSADNGSDVISLYPVSNGSYSESQNETLDHAGTYLLCAWLQTGSGPSLQYTAAKQTVTVRPPHISLAISAPASVQVGQTFQVALTAQAEVQRTTGLTVLPDTGRGCPANADAASSTNGGVSVIDGWEVTGGPLTDSVNESLSTPGPYLLCAYAQHLSSFSPPEATAAAALTVVAPPPPCVVPAVAGGSALGDAEAALTAADCTVGTRRYLASVRYPRGTVVGLHPKAGTSLDPHAVVDIVVSSGAPCVVPAVRRGTRLAAIEKRLVKADCTVGKVRHVRSTTHARGTVVRLSAKTHTKLKPRARVDITVSKGRPRRH